MKSAIVGFLLAGAIGGGAAVRAKIRAAEVISQASGTGAVARSQQSKNSDVVSVKDFGAKGDGDADDTAAVQAAWNSAPSGHIYFPCGTYKITSPISISPSFFGGAFVGANMNCVTLKATSSIAAVFLFTDLSANGGFEWRELTIDGNHLAAKGISSTQLRYISIDRVLIKATTTAAVDIAEGWDQNITRSFFQNNDGDGLRLGTNANNVNAQGNVISTNKGWGVLIQSGLGVNLHSNDISANELGGIYMVRGSGTAGGGVLNIKNNYFEGNASHAFAGTLSSGSPTITGVSAADVAVAAANVGHVISAATGIVVPSTTILSASGTTITMSANATASTSITGYITVGVSVGGTATAYDIMTNGSADATLLSNAFPIAVTSVEGNTTTSYGATALIGFDPGAAQTVRIVNNSHAVYSTRSQNLTAGIGAAGVTPGFVLEGNQGFSGNNGQGRRTAHDRTTLTPNGGTVAIDLALGEEFIVAPSTSAAFAIAAPTNTLGNTNHPLYQYVTIRIKDALGGGTALGAITWNAVYHLAGGAWTSPADGNSRTIVFSCDTVTPVCIEAFRSPADVPN